MKIKMAEEAPEKAVCFYFHENQELCQKIKDIFDVTIIPTLDKNALDPRDSLKVIKMPKINFGYYDHFFVSNFNINDGSEPLDYIMLNMFKEFVEKENIKCGDVIVGLGIFEIGCMIDPVTFVVRKSFFLRGLINHDINAEYSKIIKNEIVDDNTEVVSNAQ